MYRDAEKVESFKAEAPIPTGRLQALLVHLGMTTAPRYGVKEVPRPGQVEFKPSQRSSLGPGSSTGTRGQHSERLTAMLWLTPLGRLSLLVSIARRAGCRTSSTTSHLTVIPRFQKKVQNRSLYTCAQDV
jgi:hypothetical protein